MKESQHLEWKETWRDDYLRVICGFTNAEGGTLHIGRNDKGVVVGLPDAAKLLEDIPNKVRDVLGILVTVNLRQESGAEFIEIVVDPYPHPISYRGHYFQRSGSTLQELKGAALDRFLLRRQGRTWDGVPIPGVNEWITYQGIQRIERYPVPDAALREAILNALVHRDYAVGAPVQIRVYEDRLRIWNPCVLPEGWTVKTLLGTHPSTPFNPAIANVYFPSGEIETWGRGIERIITACKDAGTPKPSISFDGTGIALEFRYTPDYLKAVNAPESATRQVEAQVEAQVELTGTERQMLAACEKEMRTARDLHTTLGYTQRTGNLKRAMERIVALALLERTLPDKPNSRHQNYRITPKGRAWLSPHQH